jgi:alanine racemase
MRIATIPVGYYEGLDLRLSNKGFVKIRDKFCPIIGRVSMNITCVDVSKLKDIKIGEEVEVVSRNANDLNSIQSISALCNTIPYEILVSIPERLMREIA